MHRRHDRIENRRIVCGGRVADIALLGRIRMPPSYRPVCMHVRAVSLMSLPLIDYLQISIAILLLDCIKNIGVMGSCKFMLM